jgi:arginase
MNVSMIGVPYSLDQPYVGVGNAPDALLDAGLGQRLEVAGYTTVLAEMVDIPASEQPCAVRLGRLLSQVGYEVARARQAEFFPLIVGGDCMIGLGALAGLLDPASTGVVWLDAHGDFNTPATTPSGYLGGMPLACAVGRCLDDLRAHCHMAAPIQERNTALVGVRALDPGEERALAASSVMLVRATDLDSDPSVLDRALGHLGHLGQVYLHIDIDVLDPIDAPGVDYPVACGLRLAQLQDMLERIAGMDNLAAVGIASVNPEKDIDGRTVGAAVALAAQTLSAVKKWRVRG